VIARVAVFLPVDGLFDYQVPSSLEREARPGLRVWVPYGARSIEGVVMAIDPPDAAARLKPIARKVDAPLIGGDLVQLATWIADYYVAPPGEVMRLCLPAGGRAQAKRTVRLTEAGVGAAAQLGGALEPVALAELGGRERALVKALAGGAQPRAALEREGAGVIAALRALVERGLVTVDEQVRTRGTKEEVWLTPGRAPTDEDELARAPRRRAVLERIEKAGRLSLDDLREEDARAAAHVRALVEAGLVAEERRAVSHDPFADAHVETGPPPTLTAAQAQALEHIEAALSAREYRPFLLHGVTGSGKTEVYLRAIARALEQGRRALVLVPEISLTPQLAARFRGRFGADVAVLHSGLSDAARADAFRRIQRGEVRIALGARSAVFAPFPSELGIVIVDEEHDPSFKQQEGVRYHGRDVALVRARAAQAVVVLGSATPALETYAAAQEGRLTLLELPERATQRPLPEVQIVDLKVHRTAKGGFFSAPLERALEETLQFGEQAILFLNRRGYSTFILCKSCGQAVRCRDCSVTLTYHRGADELVCHYCGYTAPPPHVCPSCQARAIERLGYGTEQVEEAVRARFPGARVARLDRDTAEGRGLTRVLDGVRTGAIDVVVGTQMITKGHDFPNVTLVGVVLADHGMGLPDFRAAERTFQLLEQVAGRAGRGQRPGRVLIQTYSPEHPAVLCTRDHDYRRFVDAELSARRELDYPPALRLACVHFDGADAGEVRRVAEAAATAAHAASERAPAELRAAVVGPAEAPLKRLKGRTRWQLFVKSTTPRGLRVLARAAVTIDVPRGVRASIDVDPISML
jgi:primosomal protein N' (replication factor Y)